MSVIQSAFTVEDVAFLQQIASENVVSDEDVLYKECYRQRRITATVATDLATRLQQWLDQHNGTRWENGRLVPSLEYFRPSLGDPEE